MIANFRKIFAATLALLSAFFCGAAFAGTPERATLDFSPFIRLGISQEPTDDRLNAYGIGCKIYSPARAVNLGMLMLIPEVEMSLGMLENREHEKQALDFSCIFSGTILHKRSGISVGIGIGPAYLSRHDFIGKDLGSRFQLKSHFALAWQIQNSPVKLGYLFEHISNAGIATPNPGVNIHYATVIFAF